MIGTGGERGSARTVLATRHDDVDFLTIVTIYEQSTDIKLLVLRSNT